VDYKNYDCVTFEFFGMGAAGDVATEGVQLAATDLKAAFGK